MGYSGINSLFLLILNIYIIWGVVVPTNANSNDLQSGCLSHTRLLGLKGKTLSSTSVDLRRGKWNEYNNSSDLSINIDGYDLLFDSSEWINNSQTSNNTMQLYSINDRILIVSHFPDGSCFDVIYKYFSRVYGSKLEQNSVSDGTQYVYRSNDLQVVLTRQYSTSNRVDIFDMKRINVAIDREKETALIRERMNTSYFETVQKAEELFNENKYDDAIKLFEKAKSMTEVADQEYIDSLILNAKEALRTKYIDLAENAFRSKNYDKVIEYYNLADSNSTELNRIDISEIQEKIRISKLNDKIQDYINSGDSFFSKKQYSQALEMYQNAKSLGNNTSSLNSKIKESQEMIDFLKLRSTTLFDYKRLQPESFNYIKSNLETAINQNISKWNDGNVKLTYHTAFDTLGRNISNYQLEFSTVTNLSKDLDAIKSYRIDATREKEFYIASKSTISINANWNSQNYVLKYQPSSTTGQQPYKDRIIGHLTSNQYPFGKYYYRVKEKSLNSEQDSDVQIYGHSVIYGPQYALLSVIVPGLGSGILTQGEIGLNRFFWVGVLIGGYFAGKRGSNYYLQESAKETDIDRKETYLNYADLSDKAGKASLGLAGAIHLFDIVWTLDRGFKNLKVSSKVNERFRQQPVNVVQSQLKLR